MLVNWVEWPAPTWETTMRLSAILFAAAVVTASGAAAVIGNARADNDCRECRELKSDIDRVSRDVSAIDRKMDALERRVQDARSSSARDNDREIADLQRQVAQLKSELSSLRTDTRRANAAQRIGFHIVRTLDYQNGEQQCGDSEVIIGYRRAAGNDHIRGACAEIKIE